MVVIIFSFNYGSTNTTDVLIAVLYFIILILFTINQIFSPMPYFRNKLGQFNVIVGKTLCPIFIAFPIHTNYILFILLLITWVIDIILTHKNKNNKEYNRILAYKIWGLIVIILLLCYYIVEFSANNQ